MIDMTMKTFSKARGFTLIELMIALAISVFLIGGVVLIQSSSRASSMEAERLSRLQENIRFISDLLARDIRNAGFRDQLSLSSEQFGHIATPFVRIIDDGGGSESLEIRYAGWASCAEGFQVVTETEAPKAVSNTYFVDGNKLKCKGTTRDVELNLTSPPEVSLASGVADIDFTLMCDSGTCTSCDLWTNGGEFDAEFDTLQQACYGVRIELKLEPTDGTAGAPPVPVELNASFRNILLGQMMWQSVCQIDPTPSICQS